MVLSKVIMGEAFENWVLDIISKYNPIKDTEPRARYDLEMTYKRFKYLIECKIAYVFHDKSMSRMGELSIQTGQFEYLWQKHMGKTKVLYICGIRLNGHDVYPVVAPIEWVYDIYQDQAGRDITIRIIKLLRMKSLRDWIAEMFKVKPETVIYPPFPEYIKRRKESC